MSEVFLLHWDRLKTDEMEDRIDWLRDNLEAGVDWGFCREKYICVLMNEPANVLYRLRWFDTNKQEEIPTIVGRAGGLH